MQRHQFQLSQNNVKATHVGPERAVVDEYVADDIDGLLLGKTEHLGHDGAGSEFDQQHTAHV